MKRAFHLFLVGSLLFVFARSAFAGNEPESSLRLQPEPVYLGEILTNTITIKTRGRAALTTVAVFPAELDARGSLSHEGMRGSSRVTSDGPDGLLRVQECVYLLRAKYAGSIRIAPITVSLIDLASGTTNTVELPAQPVVIVEAPANFLSVLGVVLAAVAVAGFIIWFRFYRRRT